MVVRQPKTESVEEKTNLTPLTSSVLHTIVVRVDTFDSETSGKQAERNSREAFMKWVNG
ncbi:MAG TPA: hypothetical protein PK581_09155 [Caldisericia bacterium]|nr:hypothetical protein [Caldisericia bacterium]